MSSACSTDIANARLRLDGVLGDVEKQCALLRSKCRQLTETSRGVNDVFREIKSQWPLVQSNFHRVVGIWGIKSEQPIVRTPRSMSPEMERLAKLTPRETEVLRLITEGFSTKEIATRLGISFKTAVCHWTHIVGKANCHESATLVRLAINSGLVT